MTTILSISTESRSRRNDYSPVTLIGYPHHEPALAFFFSLMVNIVLGHSVSQLQFVISIFFVRQTCRLGLFAVIRAYCLDKPTHQSKAI